MNWLSWHIRPRSIYCNSNMIPRLYRQNCFFFLLSRNSQRRLLRLEYKESQAKHRLMDIWPQSHEVMLEFWYIERGILIFVEGRGSGNEYNLVPRSSTVRKPYPRKKPTYRRQWDFGTKFEWNQWFEPRLQ